jgi:hypothetical protein
MPAALRASSVAGRPSGLCGRRRSAAPRRAQPGPSALPPAALDALLAVAAPPGAGPALVASLASHSGVVDAVDGAGPPAVLAAALSGAGLASPAPASAAAAAALLLAAASPGGPLADLAEGLEEPVQLLYLVFLLGFLVVGAYLVVRQVCEFADARFLFPSPTSTRPTSLIIPSHPPSPTPHNKKIFPPSIYRSSSAASWKKPPKPWANASARGPPPRKIGSSWGSSSCAKSSTPPL